MAGRTDGTFNFEGGCYAKTINLVAEAEPEIYATTSRFGTVVENMVYDPVTRVLDFDDDSLTENTRCAYPLESISNASPDRAAAAQPQNIVMLTCDAFGVLPPIARLTPAQAMYHFLSGFTAKVAGTERGVTEPHADLLDLLRRAVHAAPSRGLRRAAARPDRQARARPAGWSTPAGPAAPTAPGRRMPIEATRALLTAALDGSLARGAFRARSELRLRGAGRGAGRRRRRCSTRAAPGPIRPPTTRRRQRLVAMFAENFAQYEAHVSDEVKAAAIRP